MYTTHWCFENEVFCITQLKRQSQILGLELLSLLLPLTNHAKC